MRRFLIPLVRGDELLGKRFQPTVCGWISGKILSIPRSDYAHKPFIHTGSQTKYARRATMPQTGQPAVSSFQTEGLLEIPSPTKIIDTNLTMRITD